MPEKWVLEQLRALPLEVKIVKTQLRIREWYEHFNGDVYVSFSGGKDSTVLAHLVRDIYPDVPLVFCNTGLEYPEIQSFAKKMGADVIRPKLQFSEIISNYGYPIISKEYSEHIYYARRIKNSSVISYKGFKKTDITRERLLALKPSMFNCKKWLPLCQESSFPISHMCCDMIKKAPFSGYKHKTKRVPYVGSLTEESLLREQAWIKNGCNAFNGKKRKSQPLSFWREQDILKYIQQENLEISSVYGEIVCVDDDGFEYEAMPGVDCKLKCSGCYRTGCIFCGFGLHLEKGETRFQKLAKTHPRQYEYCMEGGQWVDNPVYDPVAPKYDGTWLNWNPKKIWVPSKEGLGMRKVFDDCNQIYGKDFIRYE